MRVEGAFEAIVTREQFDRVGEQLQRKAPRNIHPRRATSSYLLSGLAKCRECRQSLNGARKSTKYRYYVCSTRRSGGAAACAGPRLNATKFERRVIAEIRASVLTKSNISELAHLLAEELDEVAGDAGMKLDAIDRELEEVRRSVERLWRAVETSDLEVGEILPRLKEQQARQESLEQAYSELTR